jgi:hypothetical protein
MTLDDILPESHFAERHARRIAAPPARVWAALVELRLSDLPAARLLMDVRSLAWLHRTRPRLVTGRFLEDGPVPVLAAEPGRLVVAGGVMQPWKLRGGDAPPALDASALRAFAAPGWVKCGVDFVLVPDGEGTVLHTETRITATDAGSRRRFAAYWLLIRLGSGLIRHEMLRAIGKRAERGDS